MSRPRRSEEDRIKQFLAASDLLVLNRFRELADFAIMAKGGTAAPAKRTRKAKDGQTALPLKAEA